MTALAANDLSKLAFRLAEAFDENDWSLVAVDGDVSAAAQKLREEIAAVSGEDARVAAVSIEAEFEAATRAGVEGILLIAATMPEAEWKHADANRTRLYRKGTTAVVISGSEVRMIEDSAPNLASWIGGNVWQLAPNVAPTPLDREQRLTALRHERRAGSPGCREGNAISRSRLCRMASTPWPGRPACRITDARGCTTPSCR